MLTDELIEKIRQIEIRTRRLVLENFGGEYQSAFKGRGMEFDEVRPYAPGDEIRTIDWNVTARTGEPYVKRFVEERELTVFFVVDASRSGLFGSRVWQKRELAAELTAVLAFAATTNNDKVGLLIFSDDVELLIPPRKGRKHVLRLVRDLLTFKPKGTKTDIKMALDTVNRVLDRRGIVFLISDFHDDLATYRNTLAITNKRNDLIAIALRDPLEREFAPIGLVAMEDAETGEIMWVDTRDKRWQKKFKEQATAFETDLEDAFTRAKVDRIMIETDDDYVLPLQRFFDRRDKRGK